MTLNDDLKKTLASYFDNMQTTVEFQLQKGDHAKRDELVTFLEQVAACGEKVSLAHIDHNDLRSPISFSLHSNGQDSGIRFSGIPSGHEFNTLILAILQLSGTALKLDEQIQSLVKSVSQPLNFEVVVSLSCHNCPEVAQTLNQFAVLNQQINAETIDGGLYPDLIESRNIQGVPAVFLNGEPFMNGKVSVSAIIDKLVEQMPKSDEPFASDLPTQDMAIIGGGPAGVSAAIYAARKGLKTTIIADRIGGQLNDTMGIENLISVPETNGPELVNNLRTHMSDYTITIREHLKVAKITDEGALKQITLSSGEQIEAKSIILATGAKWRELGVPGEQENIGNGVAYCPHCDGPFFKGKDVAVVGGGNSGIEAALDLANIVGSVTVLEFADTLKADQILIDKAQHTDNIILITNAATQKITAEGGKVNGIEFTDRATGESKLVSLEGVFIQIGLIPNSELFEGLVELSNYGEVIINDRCETSRPGVFACGDVTTIPHKQIITAMGEGSTASLSAFEYLLKHSA